MTRPDLRKNFKLTVDVNHKDLLNLEDFLDCIPLCKKHKGLCTPKVTERDLVTFYYECKDCEKVYDKWRAGAKRIECKLWEEFCKAAGWD